MLAHVLGVESSTANNLPRVENRLEDVMHLKPTDSVPVFHVEIDIASQTLKQE